ncbi:inositol polyphosphate kinase domain-containing protein [Ditylenchus destructor]|nr:inositol polyphosphate kinase domain-containing protein [Ditylenchus destructor]
MNWDQASGHSGTMIRGTTRRMLKKLPEGDDCEAKAYVAINEDKALHGLTPQYFNQIDYQGCSYLELEDLLWNFADDSNRYMLDIKMGFRTYLLSEMDNAAKRPDLYEKMEQVNAQEPTEEERAEGAITKVRYMQFRERESSTAQLGFRIDVAKMPNKKLQKNLKKIRTKEEVEGVFEEFFVERQNFRNHLSSLLKSIRTRIEKSNFFKHHEVVGSSILVICDNTRIGAWLIDFAKTTKVPEGVILDHKTGANSDGYLRGLDNLIEFLGCVLLIILYIHTSPIDAFSKNTDCGRRPFCQAYPDLCAIFGENLLDGFQIGELPWAAKIIVAEGYPTGPQNFNVKECVAVLVSDQDLLVDADCFGYPSNATDWVENRNTTIRVGNSTLQANSTIPLSNEVVLLSLSPDHNGWFNASDDDVHPVCVSTYDEEQIVIEGVVCGFTRDGTRRGYLGLTCRTIEFISDPAPHENRSKEALENFEDGAAVFNRNSDDNWAFVGFTSENSDSYVRLLDNCDVLQAQSQSRVSCPNWVAPPESQTPHLVDYWGHSVSNTNTLESEMNGGSGVIPFIVVGLIILMGVALIVLWMSRNRDRAVYTNI